MSAEAAPPADPAPAMRRGSLRNILLNAGWLLGGKGVAAALSAVYLALVTRSLGVEGFGRFALAVGIAQAVSGFASFQSWQVVVRYGMPHLHAGNRAALARVVRLGRRLDLFAATVGGVAVAAGFLLLGPRFGWTRTFERDALLALLPLVLAVYSTATGVLRLHDRFAAATFAETMTPVMRFAGAIAVWAIGATPIRFMIAWSLAEVMTCAVYWSSALRHGGHDLLRGGPGVWRAVRAENPGILRYAAITNASASLDQGSKQGLVLLLGLMVGPAAAGGFRFAQQLAQAMAKLSQTLARAIFPELMRSRAQADDAGGFDRLFRRTTRLAAMGGGIVLMLLLTIGQPLLHLIGGAAFLPVYPVLVVLGAAAAVDFAGVGFEPALAVKGRAGTALAIRLAATALLLALLFGCVRAGGLVGGAAAVLAASLLSFGLMWRAARR